MHVTQRKFNLYVGLSITGISEAAGLCLMGLFIISPPCRREIVRAKSRARVNKIIIQISNVTDKSLYVVYQLLFIYVRSAAQHATILLVVRVTA